MDGADIAALFARALSSDDEQWVQAVQELRTLGTRDIFDDAAAWTRSEDPLRRERGILVLAQWGVASERDEAFAVVAAAFRQEREPEPLCAAIAAFGHLKHSDAIPILAALHQHESDLIRWEVAMSLGSFANDPVAERLLLTLMEDSDADVRDWATFGIGTQGNHDSPEIRDALFRRLSEEDRDVREEAIRGLGKRRDVRVLPHLLQALAEPDLSDRIFEAADALLGVDDARNGWSGQDYANTLRERFGER